MLASQLRPYKSGDGPGSGSGAASGLRPTPHIIFHQLLTDGAASGAHIDMCVDGRSYGNEARFVWQSCQPNAEVTVFFFVCVLDKIITCLMPFR